MSPDFLNQMPKIVTMLLEKISETIPDGKRPEVDAAKKLLIKQLLGVSMDIQSIIEEANDNSAGPETEEEAIKFLENVWAQNKK